MDGYFLCFAGTEFCDYDTLVFLAGKLIFATFRKYPVHSIDNIIIIINFI